MRNVYRLIGLMAFYVLCGNVHAEELYGIEEGESFFTYTVQEGDTYKSIAEKFLGGSENLMEILSFNGVARPEPLEPGTALVLPGKVRDRALQEIEKAKTALGKALERGADTYAEAHYNRAAAMLEQAVTARTQALYERTIAMSRVSIAQSELAIQFANTEAWINDPAVLLRKGGVVEQSTDKKKSWQPIEAGTELVEGSFIRVRNLSAADVKLPDGSIIRLDSGSEIALDNLQRDRRNDQRVTRLRVLLGSILGEIEDQKETDSSFEFQTDEAAIAIRGTKLRVQRSAARTQLSVMEGLTEMSSGDKREMVQAGQGIQVNQSGASTVFSITPKIKLAEGFSTDFISVDQTVGLKWKDERKARSYQLVIAKDPQLLQIVEQAVVSKTSYNTAVLKPGVYYWSVLGMGRDGIKGTPGEIYRFTVQRDLRIQWELPEGHLVEGNIIRIRPDMLVAVSPRSTPSSVNAYEFNVNGNSKGISRQNKLVIEKDGTYTVRCTAFGEDSVAGTTLEKVFVVDGTAPEVRTMFTAKDDPDSGRMVSLVSLFAEDSSGVAGIEYSLDGTTFNPYQRTLELTPEGDSFLYYRATDSLGNTSRTFRLFIPGNVPPL